MALLSQQLKKDNTNLSATEGRSYSAVQITIIAHTHTHTFNGLFSRTTWVSQHQKCKPFWILLKQEMLGWQRHHQDHMQIICTTLQTDTTPVLHHSIFTGRMLLLTPNQQCQSTEGTAIATQQIYVKWHKYKTKINDSLYLSILEKQFQHRSLLP